MADAKKPTRNQLDAARNTAEKKYGHRGNVTAVDVGYRWNGGEPTKEVCVRIHVKEKIPVSALEIADVFPADIDGIPLDVIEGEYRIRRATSPSEHQERFPVLLGGISIAHKDVTAGTIAALVVDKASGRPAILSNWHVLVGPTGRKGDAIVQPGPFDGGADPEDAVAELGQSILDGDGDAAIGFVDGSRAWLPFIYGTFDHPRGVRLSRLGETLTKSGRTTAQTSARVDGEGTYFIRYEVRPGVHEERRIKGFKLVPTAPGNPTNEELSSGGDSGALWYDGKDGEAVGLHFAGETSPNPLEEHAIACNMPNVMQRLNIRLATAEDLLGGATLTEMDANTIRRTENEAAAAARSRSLRVAGRSQVRPSHSPQFVAAAQQTTLHPFDIVTNALQRNHGIDPDDVQFFHQLRATYGLNEMEIRALDVAINNQLPNNKFVTPGECQACVTVGDLVALVDGKL